jgi:hypothetical protein
MLASVANYPDLLSEMEDQSDSWEYNTAFLVDGEAMSTWEPTWGHSFARFQGQPLLNQPCSSVAGKPVEE